MKTVLTGQGVVQVPITAATVGVADPGGFYGGGPLTLEQVLALIGAGLAPGAFLTVVGGGKGTVQSLGNLGATETIDLANANKFKGTLDANCTVTFTGWTLNKDCWIVVELTQDSTGGWIATFSGVSWDGGITPTPDTAAAIVTFYLFHSDDGGSNIYGWLVGGGGASVEGGMVPYLIEVGETFTVPIKKQAPFEMLIENNGTLVVDGFLIMVN